jgi:cell pole-organizing protein PopZ
MSEQTSQEPTMEEILASIRRIISEDEAPEGGAPQAAPEPEPETADAAAEAAVAPSDAFEHTEPDAPADDEEGDLELTQKVETHGDLDFVAPSAPEPEPEPEIGPPPPVADMEGLVSDHTAQVAASAFGQLSANILMPHSDRTLEDVVRELLRPMLQQWLDANLPGVVERAVAAEVERIARGRVR